MQPHRLLTRAYFVHSGQANGINRRPMPPDRKSSDTYRKLSRHRLAMPISELQSETHLIKLTQPDFPMFVLYSYIVTQKSVECS